MRSLPPSALLSHRAPALRSPLVLLAAAAAGDLYLLRGLPNAGKSTVAAQLAPGANFAADDAFETADGYAFDAERLGAAHADTEYQTVDDIKRMLEGQMASNASASQPRSRSGMGTGRRGL